MQRPKVREVEKILYRGIIRTIRRPLYVELHYFRMSRFRAFICQEPSDGHRGINRRLPVSISNYRFDLKQFFAADRFAIQFFPNLDDQIGLVLCVEHLWGRDHGRPPMSAISSVEEWSLGSPTIATRPPQAITVSR